MFHDEFRHSSEEGPQLSVIGSTSLSQNEWLFPETA
jgi:hypothetical protein